MIEDIEFNDLNDQWEDNQDSDSLYVCHFPSEPGWEPHCFHVWDMWEIGRCPRITARYNKHGKEFYLRIYFEGESYDKVIGYKLDVDNATLFSVEGVDLTLDYFFVQSPDGKLIEGSEDKCIKIINRYWNLKVFL